MVGGRLLPNNKRNITLQDGIETMADYNLINQWDMDSEVPLSILRHHRKTEYRRELHERTDVPTADLGVSQLTR